MADVCRVIVLGSTGSIGTQTLEVIEHLNRLHERGGGGRRFEVVGLAAGRNTELLSRQAARFAVKNAAAALPTCSAVTELRETCTGPHGETCMRMGPDAALSLVDEVECDVVVAAMSGAAGLPATLAAVDRGRHVALANKETLVAAGSLIIHEAERTGSRLLPVDSEHSGLWQALGAAAAPPMRVGPEVSRVILTASGGPFRTWGARETYDATPAQALKHPTWSMGPKVTVDSASLMNKALEVIEAHWLFGLDAPRIGVLVHPQSIVHAIVEFADGSSVAQLGAPDMRTPIQVALCHPDRPQGLAGAVNWRSTPRLDFEEPDRARFPALGLATRAIEAGGTAGAILNGANESAVAAFLAGAIPFGRITGLVRDAMDALGSGPLRSLDDALDAGDRARRFVADRVGPGAR